MLVLSYWLSAQLSQPAHSVWCQKLPLVPQPIHKRQVPDTRTRDSMPDPVGTSPRSTPGALSAPSRTQDRLCAPAGGPPRCPHRQTAALPSCQSPTPALARAPGCAERRSGTPDRNDRGVSSQSDWPAATRSRRTQRSRSCAPEASAIAGGPFRAGLLFQFRSARKASAIRSSGVTPSRPT
jgi:hypothetical protein